MLVKILTVFILKKPFPPQCFSNYAPTILVGKIAASKNCQQVLWLYGKEQWITEVGAMNIFMYWKNEQGGYYDICFEWI